MAKQEQTLIVATRAMNFWFAEIYDDMRLIVNERLLRYKPRKKEYSHTPAVLADLEPCLAEWYEVSPDGLVYTVYLRRGVKSLYGNELTSEDVKWSLEREFKIRKLGRWTARISPMRNEDSVKVKDKYAVEFHLEKPNVTFPHYLASKYLIMFDHLEMKKHLTDDDPWGEKWLKSHNASYGPFFIEDYDEKNGVATYRARQDYWCAGLPKLDRIILRTVPSARERFNLLRSGEVDMVTNLPVEEFLELQNESHINRLVIPSHDPLILQINCQREPFNNPKVRQAICYAIPYKDILDNVWRGLARPLKSPFVDACLGYTEELFPYDTNVEKARALLAEAGLAGGFQTSLLYSLSITPQSQIEQTVKVIKEALAKVRITVQLMNLNEPALHDTAFTHEFDLLLDPHHHMIADGYYISHDDYGDRKWGIENFQQYYSSELYHVQAECLKATTENERVPYVRDMQRIILREAQQAYLLHLNALMAARNNVNGLEWSVHGRVYYHRVYKS